MQVDEYKKLQGIGFIGNFLDGPLLACYNREPLYTEGR